MILGMHGAMVAQGYDDPEGDLLSRIRAMVGADCFVSSELDPHSHLTDLRFDSADLLIAFKEFSHVDFVERAEELVELSLRAIRGEIKPVMHKFDCRMIEVRTLLAEIGGNLGLTLGGFGTGAADLAPAHARLRRPHDEPRGPLRAVLDVRAG